MQKIKNIVGLTLMCVLAVAQSQAAEVEAYFDSTSNELVLPHLEVGGVIYYATLTLTNAETFTFALNLDKLTDITPPAEAANTSSDQSAIVGTWTIASLGSDTLRLTFNSDGTYQQFEKDNEDCDSSSNTVNLGGFEEGNYSWKPSTGILLAQGIFRDENGECGLSNPKDGVPVRVFVDGNQMQVIEKGASFDGDEYQFVRVSN